MAQRVQQLVGKLRSAAEPLITRGRSEVVARYGQIMEANKQYVVKEDPGTLLKQSLFTSLARVPGGIAACEQEAVVLKSKWANLKELPTTEVATYVGFVAELYAWFCIGEIVGRGGSLTGYSV